MRSGIKNRERIGTKLKNSNNCNMHAEQATIYKGGKEIRILLKGEKNVSWLKEERMLLRGTREEKYKSKE